VSTPLNRTWRIGGDAFTVDARLEDGRVEGEVEGPGGREALAAEVRRRAGGEVVVRTNGRTHRAVVVRQGTTLHVALDGEVWELEAEAGTASRSGHEGEPFALSPMTGVVVKVNVAAGEEVAKGGELFVVEAMKMEFSVKAPRDLVVEEVRREVGEQVSLGETVVTFRNAS
jgi:acetyl/propionyl-CoA carboxylase alpha subunit